MFFTGRIWPLLFAKDFCAFSWERTHPACGELEAVSTLEACAPRDDLRPSLRCGFWPRLGCAVYLAAATAGTCPGGSLGVQHRCQELINLGYLRLECGARLAGDARYC